MSRYMLIMRSSAEAEAAMAEAEIDFDQLQLFTGWLLVSNHELLFLGIELNLRNAGVASSAVRATTCAVHPAEEMHTVRASELAQALAGASIEGVGRVVRITGADASHYYGKLYGRTGIIYIQDYWKRHGETTPTGDHIDVWNGYRSSTKWLMEWFSWLGYYSNYVQAKQVWFWDVK